MQYGDKRKIELHHDKLQKLPGDVKIYHWLYWAIYNVVHYSI